jgi:hypothetical protein
MKTKIFIGTCCTQSNCHGGFLQSVDFLDGISLEYCDKCNYARLEAAPLEKINGQLYHSHSPRFFVKHLANRRHKLREGEFQSFDEWKKTSPRFKDSNLKVPEPTLIEPTNKTPIEELLFKLSRRQNNES